MIHTVGPIYRGGNRNEDKLLANAYKNSLKVAMENGIRTIAFPSISTGVYGYPVREAAEIAVLVVREFCKVHEDAFDLVRFVLFDPRTKGAYDDALKKLLHV